MKRNKYIISFDTTAEYDNYIESDFPEFPNVGLTKDDGELHYRIQSPNDYQIWGTTTATENFNIKLNDIPVEVTVNRDLGEFYLTGWTGTLTSLQSCFQNITHITSIKKFALDTSNVGNFMTMFMYCQSLKEIHLEGCDFSNITGKDFAFSITPSLTDVYITVEATLMKLTNNLASQGKDYIPSSATIHYNDVDYKWQNNAWTSPNDHLFYGELVDATQNIPDIQLYNNNSKVKTYTPTVDTLNNTFYIDDWGTVPNYNTLGSNFLTNKSNIKSIKKFKGLDTSSATSMNGMFSSCTSLTSLDLSNFNTSNVTNMTNMFSNCSSLTSLDLSNWNTSNVTNMINMFDRCTSLTDVYITVEATLMKLTDNLTAQGNSYISSSATIHYNGTDYKWQNDAWTPQSV